MISLSASMPRRTLLRLSIFTTVILMSGISGNFKMIFSSFFRDSTSMIVPSLGVCALYECVVFNFAQFPHTGLQLGFKSVDLM